MSLPIEERFTFYTHHSVMTDPGDQQGMFSDLPHALSGGLKTLCQAIQGILIHPFLVELYAVDLNSTQKKEVNIRTVSEMLRRIHMLDDRSLLAARLPRERLVGNCRDHALMLCAMLRHQGVPARIRAGFATYFGPELYADHWITEYWYAAEQRWVRVDSQLDAAQCEKFDIDFDPLDIPPGKFFTAGEAWQACRNGQEKSGKFGHSRKLHGWPYLRFSLIHDLMDLNKVELLPWDSWWRVSESQSDAMPVEVRDLFDHLAELTTHADERFDEVRSAYLGDPRFGETTESRLKLLGLGGNGETTASAVPHIPFSPRLALLARRTPTRLAQNQPAVTSPAAGGEPGGDYILVRGAQQHNLKHIDVTIPRNKLVVLTGVSGSGKSSLAFDTLYAEGQRRYVESLSAYVRRYLDQMDKPKVDYIGGLSPAISIEQKSVSKNPRSSVGTITETMDYLRVLYSRAGTQHCPQCGREVEPLSATEIAGRLQSLPAGTRFQLLAPLGKELKVSYSERLDAARRDGYTRARINGIIYDLMDAKRLPALRKREKHSVELVVDRLAIPGSYDRDEESEAELRNFRTRLIDSVETALRAGDGILRIDLGEGEEILLCERNACPDCEITLPKLTPQLFSFNAPTGMCPDCNGLGTRLEVDPNLIVDHPELSVLDGATRWYGNIRKKKGSRYWLGNLETMAEHYGVDLNLPWKDLPQSFRDVVLYGSGDEKLRFTYELENEEHSFHGEHIQTVKGIVYHINRLFRQTKSEYTRRWYASFMSQQPCPTCGGTRLCAEARGVSLAGKTFPEVLAMTIEEALAWVEGVPGNKLGDEGVEWFLSEEQLQVVGEVLKELRSRLQFMLDVGLHYLTLDRPAPTLSGGEGQRIRLASQLGCGLVGVLYILDEPSIGLHARDQQNLLATLTRLRDLGNTVLVVEHDAETMRAADWLIDLGPGAGVLGGELVAAGTPDEVAADPRSLTGRYLSGELCVTAPNGVQRREPRGWLTITGARLFNLKSVTARFPLGALTCITGVSGSGKSSLVADTLFPALARDLNGAQSTPGPYERIEGLEQLDKVINITQEPIGRTPRSNPATYVGVFDEIRKVFAATPEARARGYKADRFSFNVKGGRCEACQGHGQKKIEMHFLPDVWVTCQECKGARYNRHTLEVTYKGKNIAEVLEMDVQEGLAFFANFPHIARILQTLHDVGLDYVKLGQSATTLSGGEAQRVKLAKELSRAATGRTIYILDEPTTGLHFADIQRLLDVLHRLTDAGNTVLVIEHNLDVIKTADWIVDLGPEGGQAGGLVIAEGTPEQVAGQEASYTGQFLRKTLAEKVV